MEHTKHIWRMALLVGFAIVVFFVGRLLLIPRSFGKYGAYRFDNVAEQMAKPVQHGESKACMECHYTDEFLEPYFQEKHKTVACENCHAPMSTHVKDDDKEWDMATNKTGNWCIRCHLELPARPEKQPQIDPIRHLREVGVKQMGRDWSDQVCFECHEPHDPKTTKRFSIDAASIK